MPEWSKLLFKTLFLSLFLSLDSLYLHTSSCFQYNVYVYPLRFLRTEPSRCRYYTLYITQLMIKVMRVYATFIRSCWWNYELQQRFQNHWCLTIGSYLYLTMDDVTNILLNMYIYICALLCYVHKRYFWCKTHTLTR